MIAFQKGGCVVMSGGVGGHVRVARNVRVELVETLDGTKGVPTYAEYD